MAAYAFEGLCWQRETGSSYADASTRFECVARLTSACADQESSTFAVQRFFEREISWDVYSGFKDHLDHPVCSGGATYEVWG